MKKVVIILFLLLPFVLRAQIETLSDGTKKKQKGWQGGYMVMREKGDTVYGNVRRHNDWIDFKKNETDKKKPYWADSIKAYKYGDDSYCHFKYTGWTKLIETGKINLFEGMLSTAINTGTNCFVLKEGTEPALFIERGEGFLKGRISKKDKELLIDLFYDNTISVKIENSEFQYKDIVQLVKDYNYSVKNR